MRIPTWAMVVTLLTVSAAPVTRAQDPRGRRGPVQEGDPASDVIELEEMLVEGEIERPNAFYILNRTRLGYEVLDLRTSFLPEVVDSVHGDPF
jgi:hypothetical protein